MLDRMAQARPAIGRAIKRARERKRWTQRRLAQEIGALAPDVKPPSQKTIDNWENDRTYPQSSIGALEAVLGIQLDGGQPEPDPYAYLRRMIETDEDLTRGERQVLIEAHDKAVAKLRAEGAIPNGGTAGQAASAQP